MQYVTPQEAKEKYEQLPLGDCSQATAYTRIPSDDGWDYVIYLRKIQCTTEELTDILKGYTD